MQTKFITRVGYKWKIDKDNTVFRISLDLLDATDTKVLLEIYKSQRLFGPLFSSRLTNTRNGASVPQKLIEKKKETIVQNLFAWRI